jgi:hypothetical protein
MPGEAPAATDEGGQPEGAGVAAGSDADTIEDDGPETEDPSTPDAQ